MVKNLRNSTKEDTENQLAHENVSDGISHQGNAN